MCCPEQNQTGVTGHQLLSKFSWYLFSVLCNFFSNSTKRPYLMEQTEGVKVTEDGEKAMMSLSGGDMRRVLNILQSCSMAFDEVNEDNVYTCVGHPLKSGLAHNSIFTLKKHCKRVCPSCFFFDRFFAKMRFWFCRNLEFFSMSSSFFS